MNGRIVVLAALVALLVGCSAGDAGRTVDVEGGSFTRVDADAFAELVGDPEVVTVNVHVPYDGEIDGTELFVPFDEVLASDTMPPGDARLAIYCRSGAMSTAAAEKLVTAGYTDVVELDGGMNAWRADGRSLVERG